MTMSAGVNSYIFLNVGGKHYTTSQLTLTSFPNSMLGKMFGEGGVPPQRDQNGHFIIDRDGTMFRYILNFMRDKRLYLPLGFEEYDQLLAEADFFLLPELKNEISRIKLSKNPTENSSEVVLLRYQSGSCVVEAKHETWPKLKSLKSASVKPVAQRSISYPEFGASEVYPGNSYHSIMAYIIQDGFKVEGLALFGGNFGLVFSKI